MLNTHCDGLFIYRLLFSYRVVSVEILLAVELWSCWEEIKGGDKPGAVLQKQSQISEEGTFRLSHTESITNIGGVD